MAARVKKALIKTGKILFAGFVVLVVLVGGGMAYAWWTGQQPAPAAEVIEEQGDYRPARVNPPTIAPDAPVNVSSQLLTTPLRPGDNASLTIKTNPKAECEVTVTYGDIEDETVRSTDSGLRPRVADQFGMVTWSWSVEPTRPLGSWPVEVTCANEAKSGYLRLSLVLSNEQSL